MKYRQIFLALGVGYFFAAIFLTVVFAIHGSPFGHEYLLTLIWTGIYGFVVGFLVFAPAFRFIPGSSLFWRYSVGALFGGSVAFGVVNFFFPELAMTHYFGGFAIIMGFFTFLTGSIFHYRDLTRDARQDTGRPQQGSDGNLKHVAS